MTSRQVRTYTREEKAMAVASYVSKGTCLGAAKETGIPRSTIQSWQKTDWWPEMEQKYLAAFDNKIKATQRQIIEKSNEVIIDRLENGDPVFVREKEGMVLKRKPVSAKDAMIVGGITFDKNRLSEGMPTRITQGGASIGEELKALAEQFKQISDSYKEKQAKVIDEQ